MEKTNEVDTNIFYCPHCGDKLIHGDFNENITKEILYCSNEECPYESEGPYQISISLISCERCRKIPYVEEMHQELHECLIKEKSIIDHNMSDEDFIRDVCKFCEEGSA